MKTRIETASNLSSKYQWDFGSIQIYYVSTFLGKFENLNVVYFDPK
jgi:hypothetical protein